MFHASYTLWAELLMWQNDQKVTKVQMENNTEVKNCT